jgi:hypothetical protein
MSHVTLWSADAHNVAVKMWREGFSARDISKSLSAQHLATVSRSAVLGRLHRAGQCGNRSTQRMKPKAAGYRACKVVIVAPRINPEPFKPRPDPQPSLNIPLQDRTNDQCPAITDSTEWGRARVCGNPVKLGCNWCEPHQRLHYQPQQKKQRGRAR